ncbi:unnamed protein product [Staurois parvus]|uniref:Uncharacterized protein n=1 Tax=Staurois parvus TaxID=386267 RepID=A0ABN9E1A2_9NEOB|nr:unnamed protein product [Staurois parvus]
MYQGHFMGPPTDPGPSGSARMVSPPLVKTTTIVQTRGGLTTHGASGQ